MCLLCVGVFTGVPDTSKQPATVGNPKQHQVSPCRGTSRAKGSHRANQPNNTSQSPAQAQQHRQTPKQATVKARATNQ